MSITYVCVRACVRARAPLLYRCVNVRACVCMGECPDALAYARVASLIQHAKHMRYIVLFVTSLVPTNFSKISHKRHDFRGGKIY